MYQIILYIQDPERCLSEGILPFQPTLALFRTRAASYDSDKSGEDAAEEAFRLTSGNCAASELPKQLRDYNGPALSVGDIVHVSRIGGENALYLCDSFGWVKLPEYFCPCAGVVEQCFDAVVGNDMAKLKAVEMELVNVHSTAAETRAAEIDFELEPICPECGCRH